MDPLDPRFLAQVTAPSEAAVRGGSAAHALLHGEELHIGGGPADSSMPPSTSSATRLTVAVTILPKPAPKPAPS